MKVLSHRGLWNSIEEKNTLTAFQNSFIQGFGTETDVRDFNGDLVISHDIPNENSMRISDFFELYNKINPTLTLALNIKSDGLQSLLKYYIDEYKIENYFVFDMSIPDHFQYKKLEFKCFTRQSEYEMLPCFYDESTGVWLDEFNDHWIRNEFIHNHLINGKEVCIVSPDLHKRPHAEVWQDYNKVSSNDKLMICTDYPLQAKKYFNEN
jgi:hypothetical protein